MKLYNTMTQRLEPFTPRGDKATVYVCGITPYDTTHLGHAFTYAAVDVLIRYLELRGVKVKYAQNVTDIDDDILRKAGAVDEDWRTLGNLWTAHFIEDMESLNIRPPDFYPRATSAIAEIITAVQLLLDAGIAYEVEGSVYYSIDAYPAFGKLNHLPRTEMLSLANERGNFPDDPHKKDPLDFVLWQAQRPGEPAWESPWGMGRPGWHIECSTLATKHLGEVVDIHGGGADLSFPHHECELAQIEPVDPKPPFVRFWFHTAMVEFEGEKMSKSLGNLIWVRELLETYSPDAIRLYLNSHHYRKPWSYAEGELKEAEKLAKKIRDAAAARGGFEVMLAPEPYTAAFTAALDNDLDTPAALEVLSGLAGEILQGALSGRNVRSAQDCLRQLGRIFGLRMDREGPEEGVVEGWRRFLQDFQPAL